MDYLLPYLLGGITKVYDDISDKEVSAHPGIVESFKSVLIALLTMVSMDDFYFSFTCILLALYNCGIDNPFWESIAAAAVLITIRNISYAGDNVIFKLLLTILGVVAFSIGAIFEDRLFPEEVSVEKIFFRVLLIIGFTVAIFLFPLLDTFPFPEFSKAPIKKGVLIMHAYASVSVATMAYLLYYSGSSLEELNKKK